MGTIVFLPWVLAALPWVQEAPAPRVELPGAWSERFLEVPLRVALVPEGERGAGELGQDEQRRLRWTEWASALQRARGVVQRSEGGWGVGKGRAQLAVFALEQSRSDDAWRHLAEAKQARGSVLPVFLPGCPSGADVARLPDGVRLSPALPPPTAGVPPGRVDRREAWVRALRVGQAVLDLRVAVEPEGVQIDVEHVSGEACTLELLLPEPLGYEIRVEYVDWSRQDDVGRARPIAIAPGDETHSVYGRFLPRELAWPSAAVERMPRAIEANGLWLLVEPDDPDAPLMRHIARMLEGFGIQARVGSASEAEGGVLFSLPAGPERERKLAWLASSVERFVLSD